MPLCTKSQAQQQLQRFWYRVVGTLQLVVVSFDVKWTLHRYFAESEPRLESTIVEFFEWILKSD